MFIKNKMKKKNSTAQHCMLAYLFTHGFCIILLLLRPILIMRHKPCHSGDELLGNGIRVLSHMNACKLNDIAIIFFFFSLDCCFSVRRSFHVRIQSLKYEYYKSVPLICRCSHDVFLCAHAFFSLRSCHK